MAGAREEHQVKRKNKKTREKKKKRSTKKKRTKNEGATRAYITGRGSKEKETGPIVIAIPKGRMFLRCMPFHADPQPNPNDSHPTVRSCVHSFASRPSNGATGCTTVHLPLLFACRHTYTTSTTVPLLYQQHRKRLLTTGQPSATGYHTVYEKCPTRRGKKGTPSFLNLLNHSRPLCGRTVILGAVL